jgi:hypothetical protein
MRKEGWGGIHWILTATAIGAAVFSTASFSKAHDGKEPPPPIDMPDWGSVPRGEKAFAVVETFTTEASATCPPADTLLARITSDVEKAGVPVYLLAFHSDFWDFLGWTDLYADPEYTTRLRDSLKRAGIPGMRVPLFVVNGGEVTIGGISGVVPGIVQALKEDRTATLELESADGSAQEFQIRFKLSPALPGHILNLAVVEDGVQSDILAGDNAGTTLVHHSLVRSFTSRTLGEEGSGEASIGFPADAVRDSLSVIAYVQDPETMRVKAAAGL